MIFDATDREKNADFQNLRDFYDQMKKEGLVIKQEYTLPLVDTIGRSLLQPARIPSADKDSETNS